MKKKRPILMRSLSAHAKRAIRPYANAIGELSWASNYCLNYFNLIYRELFNVDDINIAVKTWHKMRSDRAQLDLLIVAVEGNRKFSQTIKDEITWSVNQAILLYKDRNDAIHLSTAIAILPGNKIKVVAGDLATIPARFSRLSKINSLAKHFNVVKGDFLQLAAYSYYLWRKMTGLYDGPLPKRPKLRSALGCP